MKSKINAPFQSHTRGDRLPRFASCKKVNTIDISLIIIADADAMRKQKYKKNRTVFAEQLGAYSSKRRVDRRYVLIVGPRGRVG